MSRKRKRRANSKSESAQAQAQGKTSTMTRKIKMTKGWKDHKVGAIVEVDKATARLLISGEYGELVRH